MKPASLADAFVASEGAIVQGITRRGAAAAAEYRPDIDGLRAVAIGTVFVFHASPQLLRGGFIGVDVFFVISGFLIIRLILEGLEIGSFTLAGFYARRIRRIFPALILVLVAFWALGWHLMLPEDFMELSKQIFAGTAFASNLLTYSQVGYFDAPAITKPFLHLWSLGVEEQFYLVMPLALMAVVRLRLSVPMTLAIGAVASFAVNVILVRYDQAAAFYLPFGRFWELLVGGGLAYATIHFPERLLRLEHWTVCLAGLLLIGGAASVTPFATFPGWWAVPPVIGSALVIAAGPRTAINQVLASAPAVALGLISYPLYLWHWPLLVLMNQELPGLPGKFWMLLATSLMLAAATYLLVERPLRAFRLRSVAVVAVATMFLVAMASVETIRTAGLPTRYTPPFPRILLPVKWPPFGGSGANKGNVAGPKILVWGDSHAAHLLNGLVALRETTPIRIIPENFGGDCTPTRVLPESEHHRCKYKIGDIEQRVAQAQPDIAILASYWPYQNRLEGLSELLAFLRGINVPRIVVMGYVPRWPKALQKVLIQTYLENPARPVPVRLSNFVPVDPAVERYLREAATRFGARFISPMDTLCNSDGCLVRLGDEPSDLMQFDDNHLTIAGSKFLIRSIASQILN